MIDAIVNELSELNERLNGFDMELGVVNRTLCKIIDFIKSPTYGPMLEDDE